MAIYLAPTAPEKEYDYVIPSETDPEVEYYCKAPDMKYQFQLHKKYAGKTKIEKGQSTQEQADVYAIQLAGFDRMLVGWKGVLDKVTGEPIPCTSEIKEYIYRKHAVTLVKYIEESVFEKAREEVGLSLGN